jgi:hypothetical protein
MPDIDRFPPSAAALGRQWPICEQQTGEARSGATSSVRAWSDGVNGQSEVPAGGHVDVGSPD